MQQAMRLFYFSEDRKESTGLNGSLWSVDGSPAYPGAIMVGHGAGHCTIQLSADVIVLSGGYNTESYVTEYRLSDGLATPLAPMHQMREGHACGVYQDAGGHQVRKLPICS